MILEAAVEAAARAGYNEVQSLMGFPTRYDSAPKGTREAYALFARAALEAAAAHLLAQAKAEALREAAELIEPFSGIGLANGATRGDVSRWLRARAEEIGTRG